jgi:C-terminal processing protease CtpA/Prc
MKYSLIIFFVLIFLFSIGQEKKKDLNLGFELIDNGLPTGWIKWDQSGTYLFKADAEKRTEGKYSACIESNTENNSFGSLSINLPGNYSGKQITLSGFIKTEDVSQGYAGLWMRIDPQIAFDNMHDRGVKGTNDWTKVEIKLKLKPSATKRIVIGALLVGKGKMWIDDLKVDIDGTDISSADLYVSEKFPADNDHEFDNGSGFELAAPTSVQIKNLYHLGLIWGYLKYYHPEVAKGKYNWDYELFRILPLIVHADEAQCDGLFIKWIDTLGKFNSLPVETFKKEDVKLYPDLKWIDSSGFSFELRKQLINVRYARRENDNYYVRINEGVGNANFSAEKDYDNIVFPDDGYRLLALYRYWNIVQYYFPYKNLIDEKWGSVLQEFIPKVLQANNEQEYVKTIIELFTRVNDSHAVLRTNKYSDKIFGNKYGPVEIKFIEDVPVITKIYPAANIPDSALVLGDEIWTIDGIRINKVIDSRRKFVSGSNEPTRLRNIARNLLRTDKDSITLGIARGYEVKKITLPTYAYNEIRINDQDTCFKMLNDSIAYLNNGSVKIKYLTEIWDRLKDTKGLIIDIRNYPSDFVIYDLADYLVPRATPFVRFTHASITDPGLFEMDSPFTVGKRNKDYYKGKVIIIVNEITQSSAEFHAMAYKVAPNAKIIGSTTAGADGNVTEINLPGGISTMITGIGVYYPDGGETQRVGIVPDIVVKPTINGIRSGKDELLEKAIELINSK